MARLRARMSPQAAAWLKAEIAYVADRDPAAARKLTERVRLALRNLGDYPKIGPPGVIPGTRRLVVSPYVLTIRQRGDTVEVAAIRHARHSDAYAPRGEEGRAPVADPSADPSADGTDDGADEAACGS